MYKVLSQNELTRRFLDVFKWNNSKWKNRAYRRRKIRQYKVDQYGSRIRVR